MLQLEAAWVPELYMTPWCRGKKIALGLAYLKQRTLGSYLPYDRSNVTIERDKLLVCRGRAVTADDYVR